MKVTYDGQANAATIYLKDPIARDEVRRTLECTPDINLDFDDAGRLISIEVLFASHRLPKELLAEAEILG